MICFKITNNQSVFCADRTWIPGWNFQYTSMAASWTIEKSGKSVCPPSPLPVFRSPGNFEFPAFVRIRVSAALLLTQLPAVAINARAWRARYLTTVKTRHRANYDGLPEPFIQFLYSCTTYI